MKAALNDRIGLKNSWRSKILKPSKMVLLLIKSFFRIQKIHKKPFFMFSTPYWTKMSCCKKKLSKFVQNAEKPVFLKIQNLICGRNRPEIGRYVAGEVRSAPKSSQKFFYHNRTKIGWPISKKVPPPLKKGILGGGGGVRLLNVV